MVRRAVILAILLALVASAAIAQDEPAEAPPLKPCLLVDGRSYVPVAFVAGIPGLDGQDTVVLDDVPMIPVAAAVKALNGSARIDCEVVWPGQVTVPTAVVKAATRDWYKKNCKWKTYRYPGPCGARTYKVMCCPWGPPPTRCLLRPCSKKECPFRPTCRRVLVIAVGGQEVRFAALTPGVFWKQNEVRELIPMYRRQPVPRWPHVDTTFPKKPPFGVNWKRPYLDWNPDEAWLRANIEPTPAAGPEVGAAVAAPVAAAPAVATSEAAPAATGEAAPGAAAGDAAPPEGFTEAAPAE